jgi:hypothetical protein
MDKEKETINHLLLSGAMQICGVDEKTGEFLYQFTPKLKEVMPDLYREHLNSVNSEVMNLWEAGFVDVDLLSDSPLVTLTEKAFDRDEIFKLSKQDQWSLSEVKRVLLSKEL